MAGERVVIPVTAAWPRLDPLSTVTSAGRDRLWPWLVRPLVDVVQPPVRRRLHALLRRRCGGSLRRTRAGV